MIPKPIPDHGRIDGHDPEQASDHADEALGYEAALPFLVPGIAPEADSAASHRPTPGHWPV